MNPEARFNVELVAGVVSAAVVFIIVGVLIVVVFVVWQVRRYKRRHQTYLPSEVEERTGKSPDAENDNIERERLI